VSKITRRGGGSGASIFENIYWLIVFIIIIIIGSWLIFTILSILPKTT
jgi:hypothetical protein